jgi:hypothetical protein
LIQSHLTLDYCGTKETHMIRYGKSYRRSRGPDPNANRRRGGRKVISRRAAHRENKRSKLAEIRRRLPVGSGFSHRDKAALTDPPKERSRRRSGAKEREHYLAGKSRRNASRSRREKRIKKSTRRGSISSSGWRGSNRSMGNRRYSWNSSSATPGG